MKLLRLLPWLLIVACHDEPTSVTPFRGVLAGEWAFTFLTTYWDPPCPSRGNIVLNASLQGELTVYEGSCMVESDTVVNVVQSDTSAEFSFHGGNCNMIGEFVTPDSLRGSAACNHGFNFNATWTAARVGAASQVVISPPTRGLAVGTTQSMAAFVLDAQGRRLHGRVPTWSTSSPSIASLSPDSSVAVVTALASGTATITATFAGLNGAGTVEVSRPTFTSVAAGGLFTCARTATGTAWCWGGNADGQLGDSSAIGSLGPVRVHGNRVWAMLDAGDVHACGVSGGAAYCWGSNYGGQLGVGDQLDRLFPTPVSGGSQFASVRTGQLHSCALTGNGAAWCWGGVTSYQSGLGAVLGHGGAASLLPVAVAGSHTFTELSAGSQHNCALTSSATWCWGLNYAGTLGTGTYGSASTPALVAGDLTFASITASAARTCATRASGATYCWGLVHHGQYSGNIGDTVKYAPVVTAEGHSFSLIRSGDMHTCALESDGAAWCWGANWYGQLGDGTQHTSGTPIPVAGGLRFVALSAGLRHTCGITTSGTLHCWGRNSSGELGDGTLLDRWTPVRVIGQP